MIELIYCNTADAPVAELSFISFTSTDSLVLVDRE